MSIYSTFKTIALPINCSMYFPVSFINFSKNCVSITSILARQTPSLSDQRTYKPRQHNAPFPQRPPRYSQRSSSAYCPSVAWSTCWEYPTKAKIWRPPSWKGLGSDTELGNSFPDIQLPCRICFWAFLWRWRRLKGRWGRLVLSIRSSLAGSRLVIWRSSIPWWRRLRIQRDGLCKGRWPKRVKWSAYLWLRWQICKSNQYL